jgi:predicted acyl esterase
VRSIRSAAIAILFAELFLVVPAHGTPGPSDYGRPFSVPAVEPGRYGVKTPTAAEQFWVTGADGIKTFVEVWLPAPKGGAAPPARVPVVAVITPYAFKGIPRPDRLNVKRWTEFFVSHGYAMANVHLRGTGESEGCWGSHDTVDADDAARAIELLTNASFSDGNVGVFGRSHDGGAALNVAARGPKKRLRGLKTIVSVSPLTSYADFSLFDGIPWPDEAAVIAAINADTTYTGRSFGTTLGVYPDEFVLGAKRDPRAPVDRTPCRIDEVIGTLNTDGRVTPWMAERELALLMPKVTVPTLFTMGLREAQTRQLVGAFDLLRVPKVGLFSTSNHDYPDQNSWDAARSRGDWEAIVLAWLDHWLRGADNGVERWPVSQVQDTSGQWRAEPGFPRTGGPAAQLALGPAGTLGVTQPTGTTSMTELPAGTTGVTPDGPLPANDWLVFETPPMTAPLQLVGEPFADLWVTVDKPGAQIGAQLRALDANSEPLPINANNAEIPGSVRNGGRSVRFLEPLRDGRFVQTSPVDPPLNTPLRVPLRFEPTDIVVPKGARLQLLLGPYMRTPGAVGTTTGSGSGATVTVLHDCQHTSLLRFLLPRKKPDLLDVLEVGEDPAELGTLGPAPAGLRDGGGLASAPVCGRPVTRDATLQGPRILIGDEAGHTQVLGAKARGALPATGTNATRPVLLGLALLVAAAGLMRLQREIS